jgi:rod shape determining protein RodA
VSATTTPIEPAEQTIEPRARALPVFDPLLLLAGIGLILCSYKMLRIAASPSEAEKQLIYGGIGVLLAVVISRFDYSRLREFKLGLYAVMIALDLVVYGFAPIAGARRWIPLPGFSFQSSEFGKILLVVALAGFAVDRSRQLSERRTTARVMLLALVAALLVIPEPDLGTGLVYVSIGFAVLFFAGTSWKHLVGLLALFATALALALAATPVLGIHVIQSYQVDRLTAFVNPNHKATKAQLKSGNDPWYQIKQSEVAIGSGQKTGQRGKASQASSGFLPAPDTDFAFASMAEIYGFIGGAVVLGLYALLLWRALRVVTIAKNLFGTLIAGGILAMLMFQAFINIGMTVGIAPIVGVPLPLISYGGSSVIVTFIAIGLLESIYIQGRLAASGKNRALIS